MKIGIFSCYKHHNYGSMLQSYATQMAVESLGYTAITANYTKPINYMTQSKLRYYYHKITNKDILCGKIRLVLSRIKEKKYPEVVSGRKIRDKYFDDFALNRFKVSENNSSRADLCSFAESCDAVIVGSDQLWNPINVEHDFYTLTFVPDRINKISYATSIGASVIPKYQIPTYREFLNKIDYISVREDNAAKIIKNLNINKNVNVVLDPTLLFDRQQWMTIQTESPVISDKYILCYFLGVNENHRKFARELQKVTGYKIVTLPHLDEFVVQDLKFGDISAYNVGPSEFINLIRNAEYICTDSFHGTCFSIINHKLFFTLNRYNSKNSQSTNSRIDSLLSMLGLLDRRINEFDSSSFDYLIKKSIDYSFVDEILTVKRKESISFLRNALENKGKY